MQKLLKIKNNHFDRFKAELLSMHQSGENRFFQTPFSKLLLQVKENSNYIELYTKFDVFLAPAQPPLIKISFVKNHEWIDVYKSYSTPRYIYLYLISAIIFPQIFATFMGMSTGRVFIFVTFTLFFLIYYSIIFYCSMKKINGLLLKVQKDYGP